MGKGNCDFKGTGGQYAVAVFIHLFLLGTITFGIYAVWAWVKIFRLKASHTLIHGKPVSFTGTGGGLFVLILVQGLLTFVTLGIYGPWALCRFMDWKARSTLVGGKPSEFNGTGGGLFPLYLVHLVLLPILTFGISCFYGIYRLYAWKEEHTLYGGERTSFGAGFGSFLKVSLLSLLLNVLTFSLFTPWGLCMLYRWQVGGLAVGEGEGVSHFDRVRTGGPAVLILILVGLIPLMAIASLIWRQWGHFSPRLGPTSFVKQRVPTAGLREARTKTAVPKPAPGGEPSAAGRPAPEPAETEGSLESDRELGRLQALIKVHGESAKLLNARGILHLQRGELEEAERDLTQAILLDKKDANLHYNRGLVYIRMEKYDLAVRDFSVAIQLDPKAVDAYCNRGNANRRMGHLDAAIQDYTAALALTPGDSDLYFNRGLARIARGQNERGLEDIRQAESLGHAGARSYLERLTGRKPRS